MSHTIVGISPHSPMWIYEENYRLLARLLPDLPGPGGSLTLAPVRTGGDLEVRVLEAAKYTITLELAKPFLIDSQLLPDLAMKVRGYFDACVTEVVGYQGCDRIPARYQVNGPGRFLRDEKRQVNYLLNDLLRHCLRYDYRAVSFSNA